MRHNKGQSTLEYVIVLTAIIAVIVAIAAGVLSTRTRAGLTDVAGKMQGQIQRVDFGGAQAPADDAAGG